jgi:hypothetical protein
MKTNSSFRVIWPFIKGLLDVGAEIYDAQGNAKEQLICKRRVGRLTLGMYSWYLKNDPTMRGEVSKRGFDVGKIANDAAIVARTRNKSAHDFTCDRTMAADLRKTMLCPDGVLRRFHPTLGTT